MRRTLKDAYKDGYEAGYKDGMTDALQHAQSVSQHTQCVESVKNALDVEERKTGKWLPVQGYNNNVLYCSCCLSEVMGKTHTRNFCPNCGARMTE